MHWPTLLAGCTMLTALSAAGAASDTTPHPLEFQDTIRTATDRVFPALVFIKCVRTGFESGERESAEVSGSGVVINAAGEVLTNWHVVEKAQSIRCLLFDGRACAATLVGRDKDLDLAVLRLVLEPDAAPPVHAELGSSGDLHAGQFVMAMGAPWGLSRSVSIGIVSCTHRYLPEHSEYSLWLQTDASISPGNSGGPLVDRRGRIVGINTLGLNWGGDMGFSIPADTIREILDILREHGEVRWSWLGLHLQPLRDFGRDTYFEGTTGVMVSGTAPGSPARAAGIRARDRLLRIGDVTVSALQEEDLPDVRRRLARLPIGTAVELHLLRNGEPLTVSVVAQAKGRVEGDELACVRWDFTIKTINQFDTPDLHFFRNEGLYVYGVKYPGNAAAAGLNRGDILLDIDGQAVNTLEEVAAVHRAAVDNIDHRRRVVMRVLRNGRPLELVLDFARDFNQK